MNRRNLLKALSLSVGASIISTDVLAKIGERSFLYNIPDNPNHVALDKPVTAIIIGAGNRGGVYGGYAAKFKEQIKIIGVAKTQFRNAHSIQVSRYGCSPLFITAAGISELDAANAIQTMSGPFRIPTLIKRADTLSRKIK